MKVSLLYCILLLLICFPASPVLAQDTTGHEQLVAAIIVEGDTLPIVYLREVVVYEDLTPAQYRRLQRQARREERRQDKYDAAYARLKYNVYKVYPYANIAAYLLRDVHGKLEGFTDKKAKKQYLNNLEKELNKRFKGELEQFTISQGIVLVKLINRQTGRSCFDIIQEIKGGFNAVVWQGVALVFSNNLRREYDPEGKDKEIEAIVREIEAKQQKRG